jgi:uncharacterized protein YcfJ
MKRQILVTLVAAAWIAPAGAADYTDTAQVVSSTPIYERIAETRQDCSMVDAGIAQAQPQDRSLVAPIIGGVAGAILGSQVGSGRGRDAASAVGAVVGAVAADRVANPNSQGSMAGAAVGGAAGAILGNQVGRGSGRTAATATGAVVGAVAGDRVAGRDQVPSGQAGQAQRCRTVDAGTREVIRGYTVVYRYNGRDVTTTLPYNPGNTVRVAVGVIDSSQPQPAASRSQYDQGYDRNVRSHPATQPMAPDGPPPAQGGYSYRY